MNIFLSNFFLIFTIFFSKNFYLKKTDVNFKNNNIILGFISIYSNKNNLLYTFYPKQGEFLTQLDLFTPKERVVPFYNLPSVFPQKNKSFLPLPKITNKSTQIVETYYPKSLLRVKQSLTDFQSPETTRIIFDETILFLFPLFCLFSFFIYNFFKNKFFLKQKINKKLFKKVDFFFKKDFILKLKERHFSKLVEALEQLKVGIKLKSLQQVGLMLLTYSESFNITSKFLNEFIYIEKINQNREKNTLTFLCKHYFLDVKKNDIVVLTHDLPNLLLNAGVEGIVDRVVLHRNIEVTFFTTTNLSEMIPKILLFRYQTSLVKKEDIFFF